MKNKTKCDCNFYPCSHLYESATQQSEELKKEAITEFRKLWLSINKENQHLTTEKIEDLIVFLLAKQQEEFVKCIPERPESLPLGESEGRYYMFGYNQCIADIKSKLKV